MFFAIILILIVAIIAYWHYLQGLFSAGISAILSIIAAMVAVGYHEVVVSSLLGGKMADYANSIALVVTFAATYLVLRVVFDWLVPGNLHFPLLVERIGGGALGVVAGAFAAGVLALAAQAMPFGTSIAGFERFPTETKPCTILASEREAEVDAQLEQIKDEQTFVRNEGEKLIIPFDEIVLNLAKHISSPDGSLYNNKPLQQYHPDYLQELAGQRLGIQSGSNRCALEGKVEVIGAYAATDFPDQMDPERGNKGGRQTGIRTEKSGTKDSQGMDLLKPAQIEARPAPSGKVFLVVRAKLHRDLSDEGVDDVAFSPAGVRICAQEGEEDGKPKYVNYFPVGTLEYPAKERNKPQRIILYRNRIDDMLFARGDSAADLVFEVPDKVVPKVGQQRKIADGAFLEFKRLAHVDLGGMVLKDLNSADAVQGREQVLVMRKQGLPARIDPKAPAEQQVTYITFTPDLTGSWTGDQGYTVDFMEGERFSDKAPNDKSAQGTWKVVKTEGAVMTVKRTIPGPPLVTEDITITFDSENQIQYTSAADGHAGTYQRKKR